MKIYGQGSIQQADKSKTRARCKKWRFFVRTEQGQRTRIFNGGLREAKKALEDFIIELEQETAINDTFNSYATSWHEYRVKCKDYSPNTLRKDVNAIRAIGSQIGSNAISDIKPSDIQNALINLRYGENRELSGTYLNQIYRTTYSIFKSAVMDGIIVSNPCDAVKAPKVDTKKMKALSADELSEILDLLDARQIDGRVMALYLMIMCGLRCSEACGLYWSDVKHDMLKIRRSLCCEDYTIKRPKTKAGSRDIPMPERMVEKLREWKSACYYYGFNGKTVCCNNKGGILHPNNIRKWCAKNDYPTKLHLYRHSNLTIMARNVKSIFDLQHYAGWSDIKMAQVYVHEDYSALKEAVSAFCL